MHGIQWRTLLMYEINSLSDSKNRTSKHKKNPATWISRTPGLGDRLHQPFVLLSVSDTLFHGGYI